MMARDGQAGFVVLLLICLIQTVWWVYDSRSYAHQVRGRAQHALKQDQLQAQQLLAAGVAHDKVDALFGSLTVTADGETPLIPEIVTALDRARDHRIRRYTWEGGFFMAVFCAAMWVLSRSIRQYARLQRRQENFVAAVSHELKTPLASLRLAAETLSGGQDLPRERRDKLVGRILKGADRLETLVKNVLQTRWVEAAGRASSPERINLAERVSACLEILDLRPDSGLALTVDVPANLFARADTLGIDTVLQNVLGNAKKAIAKTESPAISVTARQEGENVVLTVHDNGFGFEHAEAERIFEKFYRVGDELRRASPGTGLGLYLTRRVVELDGGTVSAFSLGPGKGADFRIVWLLDTTPQGEAAA